MKFDLYNYTPHHTAHHMYISVFSEHFLSRWVIFTWCSSSLFVSQLLSDIAIGQHFLSPSATKTQTFNHSIELWTPQNMKVLISSTASLRIVFLLFCGAILHVCWFAYILSGYFWSSTTNTTTIYAITITTTTSPPLLAPPPSTTKTHLSIAILRNLRIFSITQLMPESAGNLVI